jgi:hypothetical protein
LYPAVELTADREDVSGVALHQRHASRVAANGRVGQQPHVRLGGLHQKDGDAVATAGCVANGAVQYRRLFGR